MFSIIFGSSLVKAQNYGGFLGKKILVSYGLSTILPEDVSEKAINYIRPRMTVEYAKSKFRSHSICISSKIFAVSPESGNEYLTQTYELNGNSYTMNHPSVRGKSDFKTFSIGYKYAFYTKTRTVAAPVGFARYFRIDLFSNKALNNHYTYTIDDKNKYTPEQIKNAKPPKLENTKTYNLSIGFGWQYNIAISQKVILCLYHEFNLSSDMLDGQISYSSENKRDINQYMRDRGKGLNAFTNFYILGIKLGFML